MAEPQEMLLTLQQEWGVCLCLNHTRRSQRFTKEEQLAEKELFKETSEKKKKEKNMWIALQQVKLK